MVEWFISLEIGMIYANGFGVFDVFASRFLLTAIKYI